MCRVEEARKEVGCQGGNKRRRMGTPAVFSITQAGPGKPLLMHQEYIETLSTFGEFIVFMRALCQGQVCPG